ncbi:hypothetical protein BU17DRAFT_96794 [Hysterangium stoloniferum]|nr:hypothetical protein BU17DRAFT_96794 [Hysterangium stoloniferum]
MSRKEKTSSEDTYTSKAAFPTRPFYPHSPLRLRPQETRPRHPPLPFMPASLAAHSTSQHPASSPPAQDQLTPPKTLRHRASHESGSGFRSGGVRDEVERLAVAKRSMGAGARGNNGRDSPSVRSVSGGASVRSRSLDSTRTRSFGVVLPVVLPRPPTPPPPSPPRQRFAKLSKATPNPDANASASSPTSSSLQPPSSPGRRTYSPLAAFGLPKSASAAESTPASSNVLMSPTPTPLSLDPAPKSDPSSAIVPNNLPNLNPKPDTASRTSSPSLRGSPVSGPGFASLLRAASGRSGATSPVRATSPIRTASPIGIASLVTNGTGYVSTFITLNTYMSRDPGYFDSGATVGRQ